MTKLLGLTQEELTKAASATGLPSFVGKQICDWLYRKGAKDLTQMTNIAKASQAKLGSLYEVGLMPHVERQESRDGTAKYLFPVSSGGFVESVFIPEGERATLCISSQVGCKMGCKFCMTGRQGFHGNLSAADILNQVYSLPERERLTNIVFMGQGEPLDNLDAVLRATQILTAPYGMAWSPRRITVSTVGIRRGLTRFLDESQCHLAISLHNPFPAERAELVPAERALSLTEMLAILRERDWTGQRRLSFEYTMMGGENDTPRHARELARLLSGMECRVNLIRCHDIPDSPYRPSPEPIMQNMADHLNRHRIITTIRASRGQDILAACGLLSTAKSNATR